MSQAEHLRRARFWIGFVMAGLVLAGVTAFPIETELRWMVTLLHGDTLQSFAESLHLLPWTDRVHHAFVETNRAYPFVAYGTDWLAFAHLIIAVAFIGAYRDPLRNEWLITFGLIASAAVFPLAIIAGQVRGIPWGWTLIDCSFGVGCGIPLLLCRRHLRAAVIAEPLSRQLRQERARPQKSYTVEAESWLR